MNPITIFRNLDMRWVAGVLSTMTTLESAIITGLIPIDAPGSPIPVTWHDSVLWWCKVLIFFNGVIGITQATTALPWPKDAPK